jgi:DNA-binding response OmpR family regulator
MINTTDISSQRVLVVDDEKSIRVCLQAFLVAEGYAVEVAADANEGLHLLENHDFDVIVSDIIMPQMSGIELLKAIHKAAPFSQVIMMTGEPTISTAAEALRCGAFDYLTKPVNKTAILRTVGNAATVKGLNDERRRLEQENKRYQEELEDLVDARTAELRKALEDLQDAQDQALKTERLSTISQMAGGISHDFNNVLMPILGMSDLLISTPDIMDDRVDALEMLAVIRSAAGDAREIVQRLRLIYKPFDTKYYALDLAALVKGAVALTSPKWKQEALSEGKTINVVTECADAQPVMGSESEIREILTNLIFNAVDAMPNGGTITIRSRCEVDDFLVLNVTDTGDGMDAMARQRCMEPYFTTKGEKGTGLGLPMVNSIMERQGGRMEVKSTLGVGTTIQLWFPTATKTSGKNGYVETIPEPLHHMRILVIDDEANSRRLVAQLLNADHHETVCAEGVEDGLQAFAKKDFDLVIVDRAMPNGGGDKVAKTIRKSHPTMPVIMLTGFGDMMKATGELPKGVTRVMAKPVTSMDLRHVMHAVMEH